MIWVCLCLAGAAGAVLRFLLEYRFRPAPTTSQNPWRGWPVGILLANLAGTLILAVVIGYAQRHGYRLQPQQGNIWQWGTADSWFWLLATGFCASLSTVSTLFVGTSALLAQQRSRGWCYLLATILLGLLCAVLGYTLGIHFG